MRSHRMLESCALAAAAAFCLIATDARPDNRAPAGPLALQSPAFQDGQPIPRRYSCDGAGVSPPLRWFNLPAETQTVVVVVDDPDAPGGTYAHWLVYDLPPAMTDLADAASSRHALPERAVEGKNNRGVVGWTPPCPPRGGLPHHYHFRVYALRGSLTLNQPGEDDLLRAMRGHVIAEAGLVGTYQRSER